MNNFISLITIVSDNRQHLHEKLIDSVTSQDVELEWLLVFESEHSARVFTQKCNPELKIVSIVSSSEATIGEKRNVALSCCSGEFVANLDDDDFFSNSNALSTMLKVAQKSQSITAVFGRSVDVVELNNGDFLFSSWEQAAPGLYIGGNNALNAVVGKGTMPKVHSSAALYKTSLVKNCGGWGEGIPIGEDIHLLLNMLSQKGFVVIIDDVVHCYRKHSLSIMSRPNSRKIDNEILPKIYALHGLSLNRD